VDFSAVAARILSGPSRDLARLEHFVENHGDDVG
jgi:hypothetical protein